MEHLLQRVLFTHVNNVILEFQSLFLWNIYFNYQNLNQHFLWLSVSILIFMEHLLQLFSLCFDSDIYFCFNPYFYGTSTSTSGIYLDSSSDNTSFNPYFYGTSTSTPTTTKFSVGVYGVSILIFMEHLLQPSTKIADFTKKHQFQSLFLWNIYFNL